MKAAEAVKARDEGQFNRALELLRECQAYHPASKVRICAAAYGC